MHVPVGVWLLSAVAGLVDASPTPRHAVHEKRAIHPPAWDRLDRAPRDLVLQMRVALKENNLDQGPMWLDQISHPASDKYGQHWTADQIRQAFKPSQKTIDSAQAWLDHAGITTHRLSRGHNWLTFNTTVHQAEALLSTQYHTFRHQAGSLHVACDQYSLPVALREHVDFVTPTIHFDIPTKDKPKFTLQGRQTQEESDSEKIATPPITRNRNIGSSSVINPVVGNLVDVSNPVVGQLQDCDEATVPDCLRALYNIPRRVDPRPGSSFGIVEYTPQYYVEDDLDIFFRNFTPAAVGARPIVEVIDGGPPNNKPGDSSDNLESNLDLQYAMALTWPHNVTVYQVGDMVQGASFNNFLDALDASYCTSDGGDDPEIDPIYPDSQPGGFPTQDCGTANLTSVISTSYGYGEADISLAYAVRQCNEYMKLGLMGTTFLFASGDAGVGTVCKDGRFENTFPSTCPWVLSVGATMVKADTDIVFDRLIGQEPEVACEDVIHSGGGFSDLFATPAYQRDAVADWFANTQTNYTAAQFNNTGLSRAYPDISANGARYVVSIEGQSTLTYGSSASTPVVGAILTLINDERAAAGKSSVGFVNPALYAHPDVLHDITEGANPGCGTPGFAAAAGWDPVTGLGTPDYQRMRNLFLSLP